MKRSTICTLALAMASTTVMAQKSNVMNIYQTDGSLLKLNVESIDSITFTPHESGNDGEDDIDKPTPNPTGAPITFGLRSGSGTRATDSNGSTMAETIGREFNVFAYREVKDTQTGIANWETIMNDYCVWKGQGPDGSPAWLYEGTTGTTTGATNKRPAELRKNQYTKYWRGEGDTYHFIAYSAPDPQQDGNGVIIFTPIDHGNTRAEAHQNILTLDGISENSDVYLSTTMVDRQDNGDASPVLFSMSPLAAQVRMAFYETIPGYSVTNLVFHELDQSDNFTSSLSAEPCLRGDFIQATDRVQVEYTSDGREVKYQGAAYATSKVLGLSSPYQDMLGRTSVQPTFLKNGDTDYVSIFPRTDCAQWITLMVSYNLVSDDGSGEVIRVTEVPITISALYANFRSGYRYTFMFKIYDNWDNYDWNSDSPIRNLFPCKLDGIVIEDAAQSMQEFITL